MDPQYNMSPQASKPLLSRKKIMLLIGAGILVVVAIVLSVVLANNRKEASQTDSTASVYVEREGYDRKKLGDGISDPAPLVSKTNKNTVSFQGNKVIQACNILTPNDIKTQGLLLKANAFPTAMTRTINDGIGKDATPYELFSSNLTLGGPSPKINNCTYGLEGEAPGLISINVFQPFAVSAALVNEELQDNYRPSTPVEGLEVFQATKTTDANTRGYILRKGDAGFYIAITLPAVQQAKTHFVLQAAAKAFVRELAQPAGVNDIGYESPVFNKDYTRACNLITNDDIRALSGKNAGPLAKEGIASATGVIYFSTLGDKTRYPYIQNECTRATIDSSSGLLGGGGSVELLVNATTYLDKAAAQKYIASEKKSNNKSRSLNTTIGDEAITSTDTTGGVHITFRKGSVVVDASLDSFAIRALNSQPAAALEKLTPVTKAIAQRVK